MSKYTFYEDPGHGWLAVSLHELSELGLVNKISSYSYVSRDSQTVYLEEDCDLATFLRAKCGTIDADGNSCLDSRDWRAWWEANVENIYHEDNRIRGLPSYRLREAA